jgi:hypothetical protein
MDLGAPVVVPARTVARVVDNESRSAEADTTGSRLEDNSGMTLGE